MKMVFLIDSRILFSSHVVFLPGVELFSFGVIEVLDFWKKRR